MSPDLRARRAAIMGKASTATLIASALALDTQPAPTEEERMSRAWVCDELERRFPAVEPLMNAWVESDDTNMSYTAALVIALGLVGAVPSTRDMA